MPEKVNFKDHLKKHNKLLVGILILLIFVGLAFWFSHRTVKGLPAKIQKSINFIAYVPSYDIKQTYELDESSAIYNKDSGVLSMTAVGNGNRIFITEQLQPDSFTDVPQYYPQMLDRLHQYSEFRTSIGTVTLTHPTELNGGQSAVSKAGGTLLFAHPVRNMTDVEWKEFFDSLLIIK